jgi:flagellar basal body-associated protein FliL
MESRFKSNNFIAILIALILFATGFALAFVYRHSKSESNHAKKPVAVISSAKMEKPSTLPGRIV